MKKLKMNALLALVEQGSSRFNEMIKDYTSFFKGEQGQFRGQKKTYDARPDFSDKPEERGETIIVTTVNEKYDWLIEQATSYISQAMGIEATNSFGAKKVSLIVDGKDFGELSANELMRLRNLINQLDGTFKITPVRDDKRIWNPTTNSEYSGRDVWETPLQESVERTTIKTQQILPDPNVEKLRDTSKYNPVVSDINTIQEIGDKTLQYFSGEWSHRQRAELMRRKSAFLDAIAVALKEVNDIDAQDTDLKTNEFMQYLIYGK